MTGKEPRFDFGAIFWGGIIVFFGVVLLLNFADIVSWGVWGTLWKFWPALIILIGLSFIIPRRHGWLMAVITLGVLGACLGIAVLLASPGYGGPVFIQQRDTYSTAGVERAEVNIEFEAGTLLVADYNEDPTVFVELREGREREMRERSRSMSADFREAGGIAKLDVKPVNTDFWKRWRVRWSVLFSPLKPLDLDVRCAGSDINLMLESLRVKDLRLKMVASSGSLTLPVSAGITTVDIDMDVSNLEIIVPAGVGVRIQADINLGLMNIDKSRFPRQGDVYISPDYESAANRVSLKILADVSRLTIK